MSDVGGFERSYQDDAERAHSLVVLRERRDWLNERIGAKDRVGWDVTWDVRERNALAWALRQLGEAPA